LTNQSEIFGIARPRPNIARHVQGCEIWPQNQLKWDILQYFSPSSDNFHAKSWRIFYVIRLSQFERLRL